ncbi:unnamed protein product [Rhodiola kirilowii]
MEVEGEVFSFDIFRAMKHPLEFETVHALDTLDDIVREVQPERESDPLELAPEVELKPLPEHLKYAFLGDNGTLPVIIKNGLETDQERRLIEVLRRHKIAIGWTLGDLRGISPAVCMHRILLEDGARLTERTTPSLMCNGSVQK